MALTDDECLPSHCLCSVLCVQRDVYAAVRVSSNATARGDQASVAFRWLQHKPRVSLSTTSSSKDSAANPRAGAPAPAPALPFRAQCETLSAQDAVRWLSPLLYLLGNGSIRSISSAEITAQECHVDHQQRNASTKTVRLLSRQPKLFFFFFSRGATDCLKIEFPGRPSRTERYSEYHMYDDNPLEFRNTGVSCKAMPTRITDCQAF